MTLFDLFDQAASDSLHMDVEEYIDMVESVLEVEGSDMELLLDNFFTKKATFAEKRKIINYIDQWRKTNIGTL